MKPLAIVHSKRGRSFAELYSIVTLNINGYTSTNRNLLFVDENPIVDYWVEGFSTKYRNWITNQEDFLRELYGYDKNGNPGKFGPLFTLSSLAFLHIAHDLPITIAESLNDPAFTNFTYSVCNLSSLKEIFNELEKPLREAIRGKWKKPWLAKLALSSRSAEVELIFMLWIVNLRNKAWDDGINIFCPVNIGYQDKDPADKLKASVIAVMTRAKKQSGILLYKRILGLRLMTGASIIANVSFYYYTSNLLVTIFLFLFITIFYFNTFEIIGNRVFTQFLSVLTVSHEIEEVSGFA